MTKGHAEPDPFADIRDSVRALCAKFPGDYWRSLDRERAYPTAFVAALTEAGRLTAMSCAFRRRYSQRDPPYPKSGAAAAW